MKGTTTDLTEANYCFSNSKFLEDDPPFISPRRHINALMEENKKANDLRIGNLYADVELPLEKLEQKVVRLADYKLTSGGKNQKEKGGSRNADNNINRLGSIERMLREELQYTDDMLFETSEQNIPSDHNHHQSSDSIDSILKKSCQDMPSIENQFSNLKVLFDSHTATPTSHIVTEGTKIVGKLEQSFTQLVESFYINNPKESMRNPLVSSMQAHIDSLKHLFETSRKDEQGPEAASMANLYQSVLNEITLQQQSHNEKIRHHAERIQQEKKNLKRKEDDINEEIQMLLSTIDDHKKLNEKLNKHYQKRFKIIEEDLLKVQSAAISESQCGGLFVGYNGIVIGANGSKNQPNSGFGPSNTSKNTLIGILQSGRNNVNSGLAKSILGVSGGGVGGDVSGTYTQRSYLGDKTQHYVNSARVQNQQCLPGGGQVQLMLRQIIEKVKEYQEIKVRLRDPLDGNNHLIPTSRQVSYRNSNQNNRQSQQNTMLLDKAFVQDTSRSNLNFASARNEGGLFTARNNTGHMGGGQGTQKEGRGGGLHLLCQTCLTNEGLSIYSIQEEEHHQEQPSRISSERVKQYYGGSDPRDLPVSARARLVCTMFLKKQNAGADVNGGDDNQHVQIDEILNFTKHQRELKEQLSHIQESLKKGSFNELMDQLGDVSAIVSQHELDNRTNTAFENKASDSGNGSISNQSFDNSFSLADHGHSTTSQHIQSLEQAPLPQEIDAASQVVPNARVSKIVKVPALNLNKILQVQQCDLFKNNINTVAATMTKHDATLNRLHDNDDDIFQKATEVEEQKDNGTNDNNDDTISLTQSDKTTQQIQDQDQQQQNNNIGSGGGDMIFGEQVFQTFEQTGAHNDGIQQDQHHATSFSDRLKCSPIFEDNHQSDSKNFDNIFVVTSTGEKGTNHAAAAAECGIIDFCLDDQEEEKKSTHHAPQSNQQNFLKQQAIVEQRKKVSLKAEESITNILIRNLDELFQPQKEENNRVANYSSCQNSGQKCRSNKSNERAMAKLVIKKQDIQYKGGDVGAQNDCQEKGQKYFNKGATENPLEYNFTLGPSLDDSDNCCHSGIQQIDMNLQSKERAQKDQQLERAFAYQHQSEPVEDFSNSRKKIVINNSLIFNKNSAAPIQHEKKAAGLYSIKLTRIRQNQSKNRPILSKKLNNLFSNIEFGDQQNNMTQQHPNQQQQQQQQQQQFSYVVQRDNRQQQQQQQKKSSKQFLNNSGIVGGLGIQNGISSNSNNNNQQRNNALGYFFLQNYNNQAALSASTSVTRQQQKVSTCKNMASSSQQANQQNAFQFASVQNKERKVSNDKLPPLLLNISRDDDSFGMASPSEQFTNNYQQQQNSLLSNHNGLAQECYLQQQQEMSQEHEDLSLKSFSDSQISRKMLLNSRNNMNSNNEVDIDVACAPAITKKSLNQRYLMRRAQIQNDLINGADITKNGIIRNNNGEAIGGGGGNVSASTDLLAAAASAKNSSRNKRIIKMQQAIKEFSTVNNTCMGGGGPIQLNKSGTNMRSKKAMLNVTQNNSYVMKDQLIEQNRTAIINNARLKFFRKGKAIETNNFSQPTSNRYRE